MPEWVIRLLRTDGMVHGPGKPANAEFCYSCLNISYLHLCRYLFFSMVYKSFSKTYSQLGCHRGLEDDPRRVGTLSLVSLRSRDLLRCRWWIHAVLNSWCFVQVLGSNSLAWLVCLAVVLVKGRLAKQHKSTRTAKCQGPSQDTLPAFNYWYIYTWYQLTLLDLNNLNSYGFWISYPLCAPAMDP
jgi:hypothetical protein